MGIAERILLIMGHLQMTKAEFAEKLGVSQAVLSHLSSGRNKPGLEMTQSLLVAFPQVSADWLMLEKGEMLRPKESRTDHGDLLKLINEISVLNEMNYNGLVSRLGKLEKALKSSE